jgi:hypothetical protein
MMCRASYIVAQHFLLSPKARTLTLRQVFGMSEDDAYAKFKLLRWPDTAGEPVCPACGGLDHWTLVEDRKWKCKHAECRIQFTVTSRTILASRKMGYRDLLAAIAITVNGVLGAAAGRMIREMGFAYKTAFDLAHKLREAMSIDYDQQLEGVVEIDGAFIGNRRHRLPNRRIDGDEEFEAWKKKNPKVPTSIVAIRERIHVDPERRPKVRMFHVPKEGDGVTIARRIVKRGTVMHADEGSQWEPLEMYFDTKRIDHSKSYSDGIACTNGVESAFSRLRCGERGVYRYFTKAYAERYGWEMAWREEHCRVDNGRQVELLIGSAMRSRTSRMAGYWQRHKPANDIFGPLAA